MSSGKVALTLRSASVGPSSAGPGRPLFGPTTDLARHAGAHAALKVGATLPEVTGESSMSIPKLGLMDGPKYADALGECSNCWKSPKSCHGFVKFVGHIGKEIEK